MLNHRMATSSDAPVLARMNHQLIRDEGHRNLMTVAELEQRMKRWLEGEYTAVLFDQGGEIVAYALFRQEESSVYLRQFFVQRDRRRLGIGRAAMRLLLESVLQSTPRITLEVLVENGAAREFWNAVGFQGYALTMELLRPAPSRTAISHE